MLPVSEDADERLPWGLRFGSVLELDCSMEETQADRRAAPTFACGGCFAAWDMGDEGALCSHGLDAVWAGEDGTLRPCDFGKMLVAAGDDGTFSPNDIGDLGNIRDRTGEEGMLRPVHLGVLGNIREPPGGKRVT